MTIKDIINKKKVGNELNSEEISFVVKNYLNNKIPDYQMSAFLMTIYFNNLSQNEMNYFTNEFVNSGKVWKIFDNNKIVVDKHSTGGIGDKTSLILGPIIASFDLPFVKISGRGLGHTGGTIDKLESIPGFKAELSKSNFKKIVKKVNIAIISQNEEIVPADGKIYSLRDATGSVDSAALVAISIISKKIALNANLIVIDIKCGNGAFMSNLSDAKKLAKYMINISKFFNKKIICFISNMNKPLGRAIGNAIEVKEAIDFLNNKYSTDLKELIFELASKILLKANKFKSRDEAYLAIQKKIDSGKALKRFYEWIYEQGGNMNKFKFSPKYSHKIFATKSGYLNIKSSIDIGNIVIKLGGGREKKNDQIDFQAGVYLNKKHGSKIEDGDLILELFSSNKISNKIIQEAHNVFEINHKVKKEKLILDIIE